MIPDTRELVVSFVREIRIGAVLGALALQAIQGDRSDEVSENDAYKRYGKAWIKKRVECNMIHFARVGSGKSSTKFYSVFEIETLKRAEKHLEQVYNEALIEQKNQN